MSLNKICLIGNLGKDPKNIGEDKPVASFSLGVSTNSGDEKQTQWFEVVAFGHSAEFALRYLGKGSQVYVEGLLTAHIYESAKNGNLNVSLNVKASLLQGLSAPKQVEKEESPTKSRSYINGKSRGFVNGKNFNLRNA